MISMVLLREATGAPARRVEQELGTRYPHLAPSTTSDEGGSASFKVSNGDIVVACMPAPIPWSDLEGPCATSVLWQNASDEVQTHRAHLIVTVLSGRKEVEQSILLTQATTAVLAACDDAIGVYWGNATLLVPKALFVEYAEKMLPHGPPLDIWVDCRVGWRTGKTSAGFTTGMAALGHMELEAHDWPQKPSELRERFQELARYLLEHGPVIKDRDTIGQDAREKIRVVFTQSTYGNTGRVMELRHEGSAKPWWKIW